MTYVFADCELDPEQFELRRGGVRTHVEPQVFEVLAYLVAHRDRVVMREELLAQVWGHTFISDATLSSRLMAARKAIGDSGQSQSLIRTIRGRGYRFVGSVAEADGSPPAPAPAVPLVGRDAELAALERALVAAGAGRRQVVFVTGETGAGKTWLSRAFADIARRLGTVRVGSGQCSERRETAEPYLPVLEALAEICRARDGRPAVETLLRVAPTWILQLPELVADDELELARVRAYAATPERMLREMTAALEALSADEPVLLHLDDLHSSDPATLSLLARVAARDTPARLLILGALRGGGGDGADQLLRELRARGRCVEVALGPL